MERQHPPAPQTFGALLRLLRKRARLTQRELGAQVGYSEAHINRFEKGVRQPDPSVVAARFVPALGLAQDSEDASRLVQSAAKTPRPAPQAPAHANGVMPATHTPAPRLFGRGDDLRRTQGLIAEKDARLLTLTGPPGVGKTQLSIALASTLADHFTDGMIFVPLAAINDIERVPDAVLQALGIQSSSHQPLTQLAQALHSREILLVLDNFEQLLNGDHGERAAALVAALIVAAPRARFIVTSRAPVRVSHERVYDVPPLAPEAALELFLNRAQAVDPHFQIGQDDIATVCEICARLDCLPLAIELAAARTRVFEPAALLRRLSDPLALLTVGPQNLPPRQRTLRAAIEWSYQLLTAEEQTLLRRISAFADGCTLAMLEAIAAEGLITPVADLVQSLVEKSLLRSVLVAGTKRFALLEMVRAFAAEALAASPEAGEIDRKLTEWFVEYVEDVQRDPAKSDNWPWYEWYGREWLNVRAIIQRSIDSHDPRAGLRLAAALGWTWKLYGPVKDGAHLVEMLLAHPHAAKHRHLRALALLGGSNPAKALGDAARSRQHLEEALAVFREVGDKWNVAWALSCLADHACNRAEYDLAMDLLAESTALSREVNDKKGLAWSLMWVGWVDRIRGNYAQALHTYAELARLAREMRSGTMTYPALAWTAWVYEDMGEYERALRLLDEAHQTCVRVGLRNSALNMRSALGKNALVRGDLDAALDHLRAASEGLLQQGQRELHLSPMAWLGFATHLKGESVAGATLVQEALRSGHADGQVVAMSHCLQLLGWIAADVGEVARAACLMGAVAALNEQSSTTVPDYVTRLQAPRIAATKAVLDRHEFECLWEEGWHMDLDRAVTYALAEKSVSTAGANGSASHIARAPDVTRATWR